MKNNKYFLLLIIFLAVSYLASAEKVALTQGGKSKLSLTHNDYSRLSFKSSVTSFDYFVVDTKDGNYAQVGIPGYGLSMVQGNPQLPVLKKLIEVPEGAMISVKVLNSHYQEYSLTELGIGNLIFPAQPPVSKSVDNPEDLPFIINQDVYKTDGFISQELTSVTYLGEMRGVNLARLEVAPMQYDPIKNRVKVCVELEVEINFIGGNTVKTIENKKNLFSPYFESVYRQVANYKTEVTDELIMDEPVTYIIVADPMFQTTLQPFIDWKTKKGFNVVEAYTNDPGVGTTTTSIKSYLETFYNSPPTGFNAQSFVLFVGDVDQIPAFSGTAGSHYSDLYYCEYTSDIYPECYYGRFSAESLAELQPQIDKTLEYEQYLMPDPSFLDEVVMVTGDDSSHELTWGNGQINYGTTYYFNLAHGITSHTYLQDEPTGGNYSVNIRQNVSDGVAFGNYSAHCSSSGWANPSFVNSHISALTNAHKYPLLVGNCCLSNKFDDDDCFGENLLKAVDKGALGYIGGSNSTYWDEDYWFGVGYEAVSTNPVYNAANLGAYDRTFHDQSEPLSEWYVTQGQMPSAGNLAVTQAGSSLETYYWEIYHLMGDPSLMVYFTQPPVTNATYSSLMPTGTVSFAVNTEPYAYVAISKDGVLHGAAVADAAGLAEVTLDPIVVPGTADVVVTRQNGQPYIGTVTVASPSGPYVLFDSYVIDDASGNNNGQADYDELVALDVTLENLGSSSAINVSAVLTTTDTYILLVNNTSPWPTIPDGSTSSVLGAFTIQVADNVPDQHVASFDIEITDGSEIWNSSFNITINAPSLEFGSLSIDDNAGGNGNGRLDPGETADVIIPVANNGNSNSPSASAALSSISSWITVNSGVASLGVINTGIGSDAVFNITCDPLTPIGTPVDLIVDVVAGNYGINNTFYTPVGLVLEDWETGNFGSFPWSFAGTTDWIITDVDPYEGLYSAKSGTITHNQTSELIIDLYVSTADDLSFYYKVSSESSYDYLRFYVDGIQQDEWSGEVLWTQATYPITAGAHTFKWEYSKDGSVDSGSDCAWVDYIVFPPIVPPPDPAVIELNPMSFEVTLSPGATTTEQLNIANVGEVDLDFTLLKSYLSKASKAYCVSVGGGGDEFIQNVSIGTINNTTVQSNYADYTAMSTVVNAGESYPITITNGDPNWSTDQCGIWVDWNQNEDFTDDGVIVVSGTPGVGPYTATIVPPVDALPGPTRMRTQIIYSASPDPCLASFSYGEVEDYTLVVSSNFTDWLTLDPMAGTVSGSDNMNIDVTFNATDLELGDYYANVIVNSNDLVNPQVIVPCTLHVADNIYVDLKVFVEGPFNGSEMRTDLNVHDMIPDGQPYTVYPWEYSGTESVGGMPNPDVVDWVLVEFRDAPGDASTATGATVIESQAAFLLKDGSIVGLDGSSDIVLDNPVNNNLFVVIHHRNHIAIMSADPIPFSINQYLYDFTDSELNVHGGSLGYKQIATGIWGMVSADGLCDGIINMDDKITVWTSESGNSGYNNGDFDLDANVDNKDKANLWYQNMDYVTQFPDGSKTGFKSQVPK